MIIEFIGTPGSGKTTLLPAVVEILHERGIQARTVVEASRPYAQRTLFGRAIRRITPSRLHQPLLWQVFYQLSAIFRIVFFSKHPRLVWQVYTSQKQRPRGAYVRERRVLYWFVRTTGYYEFLKTFIRPGEAILFDEGFIHRVVQLNVSDVEEPRPSQVLDYVDLLPRPDLVVYIQASPKVCKERIFRRGIWEHFRSKKPGEIARYVENAHCVVQLAVDHVRTKGWEVIEIDNDRDDLISSQVELRSKLFDLNLPARAFHDGLLVHS
jgi:thymidylate kinase